MALAPQEHVVVDAEVADQREVLVDRLDAVGARFARRGETHLFAFVDDRAGVGLMKSGEDLDQGGLARAVVANQAPVLRLDGA